MIKTNRSRRRTEATNELFSVQQIVLSPLKLNCWPVCYSSFVLFLLVLWFTRQRARAPLACVEMQTRSMWPVKSYVTTNRFDIVRNESFVRCMCLCTFRLFPFSYVFDNPFGHGRVRLKSRLVSFILSFFIFLLDEVYAHFFFY